MSRFAKGLFFALILCVTEATAEPFVPVGPARQFSFDREDGYFDNLTMVVTCEVNAIRGKVRFHRLGADPEWFPGITVILTPEKEPADYADGTRTSLISFGIRAVGNHPPFIVTLRKVSPGKQVELMTFSNVASNTNEFSFLVTWDDKGNLTGFVGDESKSMRLGAEFHSLYLTGFSGAADIAPFQLGRVGPGSKKCKPIV